MNSFIDVEIMLKSDHSSQNSESKMNDFCLFNVILVLSSDVPNGTTDALSSLLRSFLLTNFNYNALDSTNIGAVIHW